MISANLGTGGGIAWVVGEQNGGGFFHRHPFSDSAAFGQDVHAGNDPGLIEVESVAQLGAHTVGCGGRYPDGFEVPEAGNASPVFADASIVADDGARSVGRHESRGQDPKIRRWHDDISPRVAPIHVASGVHGDDPLPVLFMDDVVGMVCFVVEKGGFFGHVGCCFLFSP